MLQIAKLQEAIDRVVNGQATQYLTLLDDNGNDVKFRISNHNANPQRMESIDYSLVINREENEDEENNSNWVVNKKEFRDLSNQYQLDSDGDFKENWSSLKEFFNYSDIAY